MRCAVLVDTRPREEAADPDGGLFKAAMATTASWLDWKDLASNGAITDCALATHDGGMLVEFGDYPGKAAFLMKYDVCPMRDMRDCRPPGDALAALFSYLCIWRVSKNADTMTEGRDPARILPVHIIWILFHNAMGVPKTLELPGIKGPGADFYVEPFRWDQKMHSIVFTPSERIAAGGALPEFYANVQKMCEITGGTGKVILARNAEESTSFLKQSLPSFSANVLQMHEKLSNGWFIAALDAVDGAGKLLTSEQHLTFSFDAEISLHQTPIWCLPEDFLVTDKPHQRRSVRRAHPVMAVIAEDRRVEIPSMLPFDVYRISNSTIAQRLNQRPVGTCWTVFLPGSLGNPKELGHPFAMLRKESDDSVCLLILPYNFLMLLSVIKVLESANYDKEVLETRWRAYLKTIPPYYHQRMAKALKENMPLPCSDTETSWRPEEITHHLRVTHEAAKVYVKNRVGRTSATLRNPFVAYTELLARYVNEASQQNRADVLYIDSNQRIPSLKLNARESDTKME